jgi:hypothetical protein
MMALPPEHRHASSRVGEATDRVKHVPLTCWVTAMPMLSPDELKGVSILIRVPLLDVDVSWARVTVPTANSIPSKAQITSLQFMKNSDATSKQKLAYKAVKK